MSAHNDPLAALTPYQRRIALMVGDGHHNREISRRLSCSEGTVKSTLSHIYQRLDIRTAYGWTPRVRLARMVWEQAVGELVEMMLEGRAA